MESVGFGAASVGLVADSVGWTVDVLEEVVPVVVGFWIVPLGFGEGVVGTRFSSPFIGL